MYTLIKGWMSMIKKNRRVEKNKFIFIYIYLYIYNIYILYFIFFFAFSILAFK